MLAPPRSPAPPDDLEALIREARARQRRRRVLFAASVAVAAAVGLSLWAAIPGQGSRGHAANGGRAGAAGRGIGNAVHVPIVQAGTSGGVTWAINGAGMWLTTNGGRTWRASAPAHVRAMGDLPARVEQVNFLDRRHGWLLAVDVKGLRPAWRRHAELDWTSDGGRTWHWTMPHGSAGPFSFVDRRLGFFSGDNGFFETQNGGAAWKAVEGTYYGGLPTFIDARRGVMLLDGGLLRTADGGRHWKGVLLSGQPPAAGNDTFVSPPVAVFGHRLVLTAERVVPSSNGPDDWRVFPYVSDDGGVSWSARPFPSWWVPLIGSNDGSRFSAASGSVWFAAARRQLAVTTDAGRTWRRVRPVGVPPRWIIGAIDFTSLRVGWAIFNGPRQSVLMRTTDGGVYWQPAGPRARRHREHR
jgi:photosystem II stability/assembly factor-like uncharacterized protein